ncbi:MAG: sulfate adenylyltransferase subunit 2 [Candidatus Azotimanducaceae bacterium]|jgi:sulfate adenylyltransferase subunit 2
MDLPTLIYTNRQDSAGNLQAWDTQSVHASILDSVPDQSLRTTERALEVANFLPAALATEDVRDERDRAPKQVVLASLLDAAKKKRHTVLVVQTQPFQDGFVLMGNDGRLGRRWVFLERLDTELVEAALFALVEEKPVLILPHGDVTPSLRSLADQKGTHMLNDVSGKKLRLGTFAYQPVMRLKTLPMRQAIDAKDHLTHIDRLEAESIHIMREVMAQAENPVMLYSVGKDSAVMLHLAKKAFFPSPPPFPLMHIDTRWKFQEMYEFRDYMAQDSGMELITHINPEGIQKNMNPFDHGSAMHTDVMKTQGLKQALDHHQFDVAFGGARRDEEKSRAKERVFSFRTAAHRWEPKSQRPELWNVYNGYKAKGESIRVFPLSNWTELDIWQYIYREQIPIVPLYYAAERPVVERDGLIMMVDDDRLKLFEGEEVKIKKVRFRTLGCYPLTGAVESEADDLASIVLELLQSKTSERQGRAIDSDSSGSMEKKKQEGYF